MGDLATHYFWRSNWAITRCTKLLAVKLTKKGRCLIEVWAIAINIIVDWNLYNIYLYIYYNFRYNSSILILKYLILKSIDFTCINFQSVNFLLFPYFTSKGKKLDPGDHKSDWKTRFSWFLLIAYNLRNNNFRLISLVGLCIIFKKNKPIIQVKEKGGNVIL